MQRPALRFANARHFMQRQYRHVLLLLIATSSHPAAIPAQAAQPRLRAQIRFQIGDTTGMDERYTFGIISGLAMTRDGSVIVSDSKQNNVRLYNASGKFVWSFGKTGEGPGDLRQPCCITIGPSGKLWIEEFGNRRLSVASIAPTRLIFERTVPMPDASVWSSDRVAFDPLGRILHLSSVFIQATKQFTIARLFLDQAGTVKSADTLSAIPADSLQSFVITRHVPGGVATNSLAQPLGPVPLLATGPNADYARAMSSNYSVRWFDYRAQVVTTIYRHIDGPAVSARERDSVEAYLVDAAKHLGLARSDVKLKAPLRKAPLDRIGFDLDGRLWVERSVADGADHVADVYDRHGKQLFEASWPTNVEFVGWTISNRSGLGVLTDDDGSQRVAVIQFAPR